MRRMIAVFAALGFGATVAAAPPASAACAGTTGTIIVCTDPTGTTLYEDCVVIVEPPCIPVSVPGPTVWCEGAMAANCDPFH